MLHFIGLWFLITEILFASFGCYCIWGIWLASHSNDAMVKANHEWDGAGLFLSTFFGAFLALIAVIILGKSWTCSHIYLHFPWMICVLRAALLFGFNR